MASDEKQSQASAESGESVGAYLAGIYRGARRGGMDPAESMRVVLEFVRITFGPRTKSVGDVSLTEPVGLFGSKA